MDRGLRRGVRYGRWCVGHPVKRIKWDQPKKEFKFQICCFLTESNFIQSKRNLLELENLE
jgi:hypothetical protein